MYTAWHVFISNGISSVIMDFSAVIIEWFPYLIGGIFATLGLVASALILGVLFGLPMAVGQVYGKRPVRFLIGVFVWFFLFWHLSRAGT